LEGVAIVFPCGWEEDVDKERGVGGAGGSVEGEGLGGVKTIAGQIRCEALREEGTAYIGTWAG